MNLDGECFAHCEDIEVFFTVALLFLQAFEMFTCTLSPTPSPNLPPSCAPFHFLPQNRMTAMCTALCVCGGPFGGWAPWWAICALSCLHFQRQCWSTVKPPLSCGEEACVYHANHMQMQCVPVFCLCLASGWHCQAVASPPS